MSNRGFLYVWCAGYWKDGKFYVPRNLYHLKLYSENSFKFLADLSKKYPDEDWKIISERARNELCNSSKVKVLSPVNTVENSNRETCWNFSDEI